ncbi:MAG: hypothetical protein AB8G22_19670 [Saprospiraceae bacterium]
MSRVAPNNEIASQDFGEAPQTDPTANAFWIDPTAQVLRKPDEISIANNYRLIQLVLGNTSDSRYVNIDSDNFNETDLKSNIHTWIRTHTDTHSLSEVEQQRLYYLMLNYFRAYLLAE